MHALHRILVHIDSETICRSSIQDIILQAHETAEDALDRYADRVFDWREDDPGRWCGACPDVILGCENPKALIDALIECRDSQKDQISVYLDQIVKETQTTDIREIVEKIRTMSVYDFGMPGYYLRGAVNLADGIYIFDSCFYDAEQDVAKICDERLKDIQENISEYALVMFDLHN